MTKNYIATFITTTGQKITLRIGKGKELISTSEAKSALTKILNANILLPELGNLQNTNMLKYIEIKKIPFVVL